MGQCVAPCDTCYDGLDAMLFRHLPKAQQGASPSALAPWTKPWTEPWLPPGAQRSGQTHWAKLRAFVRARMAFGILLQELRTREVERLYENNWSEVNTPTCRQPSLGWRKMQALTTSSSSLQELLNDVRCKQAENLYAADWNALKPGQSLMSAAAAAG
ncbi:unnamed protein product [Cladocopium goreaui]|uniref:Uncharacterized protein n=1 Tax=Cladocopium goreaui TaxID=2562237 RepID=A0A9P1BYD3_9DINO|nr:unnamed protein product [Cladocopium goreaui]|mmetsp:Transcript_70316/g.142391  ORF Transcript_70316/g.142391 Transcript_70316/m.142391 type:complete len:158 (+) Transcript_70316:64-537(+)